MVTDDERRRVAAALREYASFDCEDEGEEECLVDCTDWGERVLNLLGCGDTEGECYAALADLIDPGELKTTCIAEVKIEGEKLDEAVNRAIAEYTGIDRDALLALADELEEDACWEVQTPGDASGAWRLKDACDRIREALRVES